MMDRNKLIAAFMLLTILIFAVGGPAISYGDEDEDDGDGEVTTEELVELERAEKMVVGRGQVIAGINSEYLKTIKPIFEKKCFDCHNSKTEVPWYASVPGVKQLISEHREEAVEDFDMTDDFPFTVKGGGIIKSLKELEKTVNKGDMPPISYVLVHWSSRLNNDEKQVVNQWTRTSLKLMEQPVE